LAYPQTLKSLHGPHHIGERFNREISEPHSWIIGLSAFIALLVVMLIVSPLLSVRVRDMHPAGRVVVGAGISAALLVACVIGAHVAGASTSTANFHQKQDAQMRNVLEGRS
jgi:protein-S-isoprenylcysteine O-methyltransferase Ste14